MMLCSFSQFVLRLYACWKSWRSARRAYARLTPRVLGALRGAGYRVSGKRSEWIWPSVWRFLEWRRCGERYAIAHIRDGPWLNARDRLCIVDLTFEWLVDETPVVCRILTWHVTELHSGFLLTVYVSFRENSPAALYRFLPRTGRVSVC